MSQIKSKDRVHDLAEVCTNERDVNAMFNLAPSKDPDDIITYRYLEPACGNGDFLIEVLRRKLARVNEKYANTSIKEYEFYIASALTTIYGIDIGQENVSESRARLFAEVKATFDTHKGCFEYSQGFLALIDYILTTNIVVGDSTNAPQDITLTEFKIKNRAFIRSEFCFADLTQDKPEPIEVFDAKHFLNIGFEHAQKTGTP